MIVKMLYIAIELFDEPPTELSACMCECRNIAFKSMWVEGLAPQFLYVHYLGSECQLSSLVLLSEIYYSCHAVSLPFCMMFTHGWYIFQHPVCLQKKQ